MSIEDSGTFGTGSTGKGRIFLIVASQYDSLFQLEGTTYMEFRKGCITVFATIFGFFHQGLVIIVHFFPLEGVIGDGQCLFHVESFMNIQWLEGIPK